MSSFLLYQVTELEHEFQAFLNNALLLFSFEFKECTFDWIKLSCLVHLTIFITLFDLLLYGFDLGVQVSEALLNI